MKVFLSTLIICFGFSAFALPNKSQSPKSEKKYKTKHVFILVLDGPRWSETFGDSTYQYVPNMKHKLAPKGVFFNNFTNDGPTYTLSGHTAITTGVYQKLDNTGKRVPKNPSMFQYYLKQHKKDKRKAWVLTSKGKLNVIGHTSDKKWKRQYYPSVYAGLNGSGLGYPSDKSMLPIFQEIITENVPNLAIINLLDITGKTVLNVFNGVTLSKEFTLLVPLNKLPSGLYFYQIIANSRVYNHKIIKQ